MKPWIFVVLAISYAAAVTASAQVVIRGTESSDKSATQSEVTITTMDRTTVPLIKQTQQTKEDKNTQRTESVTRTRLSDGSYFDSQRSTTIKKEVALGVTAVSTDVVEKDRQGDSRTTGRTTETVIKTDAGEKIESKTYTRNSSGQLVLDSIVEARTIKGTDGRSSTTRVEKVPDINGNPVLKTQVEEVALEKGPNEKLVTAQTKSVNHLTGQLEVTAEATTSIRMDGDAKKTETVVRTPGRTGWQVSGRTTTMETTGPDGSVNREIIEQGRSLYSARKGDDMEALMPQRKVVEREVHQPDGSTMVQREAFRRDVNGDWKPESFSTNEPSVGMGQRPAAAGPAEHQPAPKKSESAPPPPPAMRPQ